MFQLITKLYEAVVCGRHDGILMHYHVRNDNPTEGVMRSIGPAHCTKPSVIGVYLSTGCDNLISLCIAVVRDGTDTNHPLLLTPTSGRVRALEWTQTLQFIDISLQIYHYDPTTEPRHKPRCRTPVNCRIDRLIQFLIENSLLNLWDTVVFLA